MTEWKDAYIGDESEMISAIPQVAWSVTSGGLEIWVASGHRPNPGRWVCTCRALSIYAHPIGFTSVDSAKEARARAHALVGDEITDLHNDFLKISEE